MKKAIFLVCALFLQSGFARDISNEQAIVRTILDSAGLTGIAVDSVATIDTLGRVIALVLTNKKVETTGITRLPPEIGNLTHLRTLLLDKNDLSTLPPEIGNLTKLITFNMQYNQLTELPASIGNCKALECLDLRSNKLSTLPRSLFLLKSLRVLQLSGNKLASLPVEIDNLSSLKELWVERNDLCTLPSSIMKMKLTYFDFSDNKILVTSVILDKWLQNWNHNWKDTQNPFQKKRYRVVDKSLEEWQ